MVCHNCLRDFPRLYKLDLRKKFWETPLVCEFCKELEKVEVPLYKARIFRSYMPKPVRVDQRVVRGQKVAVRVFAPMHGQQRPPIEVNPNQVIPL